MEIAKLKRMPKPIGFTRELSEKEKAKMYLLGEAKSYIDFRIMLEIAKCESGFRQFDVSGNVLRGVENNKDVGRWQISEAYWLGIADKLGYNIQEEDGNTLMAIYIYNNYGTNPWNWSRKCWQPKVFALLQKFK